MEEGKKKGENDKEKEKKEEKAARGRGKKERRGKHYNLSTKIAPQPCVILAGRAPSIHILQLGPLLREG